MGAMEASSDDGVDGQRRQPGDEEAVDQARGPAVGETLREQRQDRLPRDQLAHGEGEQRPEAKAPLEDLLLAQAGQDLAV